jgi:hypothetical protein
MPKEQSAQVARDIESLNEEQKALYGDLYLSFKGILKGAAYGLEPSAVAQVIVTALEEEQPKSRYQIGQDSLDTIKMAFTASDEEFDAFWEQVFASGLIAAEGDLTKNLVG